MSAEWFEGFLDLVGDLTGWSTTVIAKHCLALSLTSKEKILEELTRRELAIKADLVK